MKLINVPDKKSRHSIVAFPLEGGGFRFLGENSSLICHIQSENPQRIADDLAYAFEQMRDIGFKQGLASVREALEIKG